MIRTLTEAVQIGCKRFVAKSPFRYRVLNWFLNVCLLIGMVQEFTDIFGLFLPEPYNKIFIVSAGVVRLLSGFTVEKPKQDETKG